MTTQTFTSVWDAIENDTSLGANLKLRSSLMMEIADFVQQSGMTQVVASKVLGTTQPRLNDVLKGRIEKCTVDRLVNMLGQAGFQVEMQVHKAA